MGTRGLYGIRKDGVDKLTYNHFDSYPSGLGNEIVGFIQNTSDEGLNKFFDLIRLVDGESKPKYEDIDACIKTGIANLDVSDRSVGDWYCLTRELQGDFKKYKELINTTQTIYMLDEHEFIKDSLFCEYAYIINLDDKTLEYYVGFQKQPDKTNRYGVKPNNDYYPCKMLKAFSFEDIRSKADIDIAREMEELEEVDA